MCRTQETVMNSILEYFSSVSREGRPGNISRRTDRKTIKSRNGGWPYRKSDFYIQQDKTEIVAISTRPIHVETDKLPSPRTGNGCKVLLIVKKLIVTDMCWKRKTHFFPMTVTGYINYIREGPIPRMDIMPLCMCFWFHILGVLFDFLFVFLFWERNNLKLCG